MIGKVAGSGRVEAVYAAYQIGDGTSAAGRTGMATESAVLGC